MQYEALNHRGTAVVMERDQVDTDQIMPKQFLTSTERTGYGNHLFDSWRFLDRGEFGMKPEDRQLNPDFELNHPSAKGASILIATTEFGCGSSREHAVWGMLEYGFRAVIAESFGEIFESNARKGGLVPVRLPPDQLAEVMAYVRSTGQAELEVDLEESVLIVGNKKLPITNLSSYWIARISTGADEIEATLGVAAEDISAFETAIESKRSAN